MGKLSGKDLRDLLSCIKKDPRVILPPTLGHDFGVHKIGDKYLVVASDPCSGVPDEWFGFLLVNYAASDVALSGAKPEFCTINLLGPLSTDPKLFKKIMGQICQAADELQIAIVRGHTGTYDSLNGLVGVATVYGSADAGKLITSGGAKPGDLVMFTKSLGLETVTNFALTKKELARELFGHTRQRELAKIVRSQSCVREAIHLAEEKAVHAMHDSTEGGLVAALNEIAEASGTGFKVDLQKILMPKEVLSLQNHFKLSIKQVLSMSSTGNILAAVDPNVKERAVAALKQCGLDACFIGEFTENKERLLIRSGKETPFPDEPNDPYAFILETN